MLSVFVGIDVACAKGKWLPICFTHIDAGKLIPLRIPEGLAKSIPRGIGNCAVLDRAPFADLANEAVSAMIHIAREMEWSIARVAIDAPAAPGRGGSRQCETELNAAGLSVFKTPQADRWPEILIACREHLRTGGEAASSHYVRRF